MELRNDGDHLCLQGEGTYNSASLVRIRISFEPAPRASLDAI